MLIQLSCPYHGDVIEWKHFPRYWPFVRGIHRSPLNSPYKACDAELWCFLWSASELGKQSWGLWFETLLRPLWRHCNGVDVWLVYMQLCCRDTDRYEFGLKDLRGISNKSVKDNAWLTWSAPCLLLSPGHQRHSVNLINKRSLYNLRPWFFSVRIHHMLHMISYQIEICYSNNRIFHKNVSVIPVPPWNSGLKHWFLAIRKCFFVIFSFQLHDLSLSNTCFVEI